MAVVSKTRLAVFSVSHKMTFYVKFEFKGVKQGLKEVMSRALREFWEIAAVYMNSAVFWDVFDILTLEDGTDT